MGGHEVDIRVCRVTDQAGQRGVEPAKRPTQQESVVWRSVTVQKDAERGEEDSVGRETPRAERGDHGGQRGRAKRKPLKNSPICVWFRLGGEKEKEWGKISPGTERMSAQ